LGGKAEVIRCYIITYLVTHASHRLCCWILRSREGPAELPQISEDVVNLCNGYLKILHGGLALDQFEIEEIQIMLSTVNVDLPSFAILDTVETRLVGEASIR